MDVQETGRKEKGRECKNTKIQASTQEARGGVRLFLNDITERQTHDENGMEGGEKVTAVVTLCESNHIRRTTHHSI